jgi:DNA-binding NarL/FixJ family response regulator
VLAVDDQASFLELLSDVLQATDHLEAVGEARSGEQAVELTQAMRPDIVLLDLRMPGMDGAEAARQIKTKVPATLVVLLTTTHPSDLPPEATKNADALIWKSELEPKLLDEIWLWHRPRTDQLASNGEC